MSTITITLTVNTADINTGNIDDNVSLSDGSSEHPAPCPENFTTRANVGDTIRWVGETTSDSPSGDTVAITSIVHEGDSNIFATETLQGNGDGEVEGQVRNNTAGEDEIYIINFNVTHSGPPASYRLDPKIVVEPE